MKIRVICASIIEVAGDLLIVNEFEGVKRPGGATGAVDKALGGLITQLSLAGEINGKLGSTTIIHTQGKIPAKHILVVGLGKDSEFDLEAVRTAAAAAIKAAKSVKAKKIATIVHGAGIGGLQVKESSQALVEGSLLGDYKYDTFKRSPEEPEVKIEELMIVEREKKKITAIEKGVETGRIISEAVNRARDLVNGPSNEITPTYLAEYSQKLSKELGLKCTVLNLSEIKQKGMEALWSIAKGSQEPAKLIVLQYNTSKKPKELIGLIGKGITFDAGGISLKPSRKLSEMKTDMAGAATVIEVMRAIAQLKSKKSVLAVIPATENMPDGGALKPGDIIGSLSGKTMEIISTDAEGRIILSDAITYAKKLGAKKLIDIATLTGGCITALGDIASGVVGNDQALINSLIEAGRCGGEKLWQLPLYKEYKEYLKSDIADMKNCMENGKASPSVGAVFLQNFVDDTPWAHIDIAGTAYISKDQGYLSAGATGAGVRTLIRFLMGE